MIQVSAQYGEPKAADALWPLHKELNDLFREHLKGSYSPTIREFGIVLRASGKVHDFGGEGTERLEYVTRDRDATVDLVIPADRWRGVKPKDLRGYLAQGIRQSFEALVGLAKTRGELDEQRLRGDFQAAMTSFENRAEKT